MQGIVYLPENPQTGSPPPNKTIVTNINMELPSDNTELLAKENSINQSNRSDSGIFSATGNSTNTSDEHMDNTNHSESGETDNHSNCSSPDRKFLCPICETMLTSQHEFTLHIRSHNNENEAQDNEKGFTCRICCKVLSSSSSLDRHVLVHSGERPFTCKYCGDTFTTNGNMHRHMRTHSHRNENYESDESTDSSASEHSKSVEFNNNKISAKFDGEEKLVEDNHISENKRKCYDEEDHKPRIKVRKLYNNDRTKTYKCPVCERDDFTSLDALDMHLEDNHTDYPAKCHICNVVFKNNKLLSVHRSTAHSSDDAIRNLKNSVVGFKDLTFVDFSSQKFPHIARYECEKNLHKASSGLKFQCEKCSRAFPCASSLEIHHMDCISGLDLSTNKNLLDLTKNNHFSEKEIRRADFFARLDLQNKLSEKAEQPMQMPEAPTKLQQRLLQSVDGGKDLADIQSIISLTTNGSLLQQLQGKTSEMVAAPQKHFPEIQPETKHENEEESQDLFAAEFRKMKLRGEFPCRLCTAVFPNLRALKGHNRAHLNGNNNGTYRCNMCPHSSIDKAALIRHMRTHNGDRPYECSLCNYAFTTKANCERHLRNRHAKTTREEVKKSIIYHPTEDPSNDEISKLVAREEKKINTSLEINDNSSEKIRCSTPKSFPTTPEILKTPEKHHVSPYKELITPKISISANLLALKDLSTPKDYTNNFKSLNDVSNDSLMPIKEQRIMMSEQFSPYSAPSFNFSPKNTNSSTPHHLIPKIQVDIPKQVVEYENNLKEEYDANDEDQPLNLVLDLSKKKMEKNLEIDVKPKLEEVPQDLTKKSCDIVSPHSMNEILAQQLLKNTPKIDPASLYASQLAFYRNGFTGLPGLPNWSFPLNPLLFPGMPNPLLPQDPQEIKERLQRLQLCGGGMIMDNFAERLKNFHQHSLNSNNLNAFNNMKLNDHKSEINFQEMNYSPSKSIKSEDLKPLTLNIDQNFTDNLTKLHSPLSQPKSEMMQSPNSVKMVIKNGVLMPKQKQRRYRTERPFSCEHCSARFTLRSNMERHIKQQHPQFWSQRQRSNIGSVNRKNQTGHVTPKNNFCNINIPNYDTPKSQHYEETKDNQISDKIKYAILAQHLKTARNFNNTYNHDPKPKEDDDDCALVIDENDEILNRNNDKTDNEKNMTAMNDSCNDINYDTVCRTRILEEKLRQLHAKQQLNEKSKTNSVPSANFNKHDEPQDLVPVSRLLDNASQQQFKEYFRRDGEEREVEGISEEDEEGLVASCSTSEGNNSGTDENRSESENTTTQLPVKKKSAYSLAPNRVSCPYCQRKFPWTSSLRRHVLTHTGQKPFKCSHCPLLFTTKSNCDRHLLRKHGNAAVTINNDSTNNNNSNYLMRNVPERPFKCSSCPSSTFSTYSNLKKHISCKHLAQGAQSDDARSQVSTGYEAGSSEDEKMPTNEQKTDWDKQVSHNKLPVGNSDNQNAHLQNSDLPFKCHLCDNSFSERQDALDHIKDKHTSEYELLMSKNALDTGATTPDENIHHDDNEDNEIRGKFPDYANRKVICAFCMRRFWSAEDLRRHMRTHTGERPFSCDICHRRFTLKHSMLRHRKKHNVAFENDNINSDEDNGNLNFDKFVKGNNNNLLGKSGEKTDESDGAEGGSDLISNLLGIRDRSIIDQVLTASADDAAKLLGVKSGEQE